MVPEFKNEPLTDFSKEENRRAFEAALEKVKKDFGKEYDLIIGGERIKTAQKIISYNPSNKDEIIGYAPKASQEQAEKAMQVAAQTFETWKRFPAQARARMLFKAAAILRRKKHEFSATMVVEAGKSWPEADADTAEAIDFMEFYGREMIRLAEEQPLTRIPTEDNQLTYISLGVGVVIPPWNFPLAILTGMTTAAVVAGNTVVLKPASTTPIIAYKFMELMEDAGMPAGVINYLPGSGGEIGDFLVSHKLTRFIAFTGSLEVGKRINNLAAQFVPGQKWIKRVILELGGKDTIIVDKDADIDLAVNGIVASAFGFQGQKCSAASRIVVHQDVYDEVMEKVKEKTKQLRMGNVEGADVNFGPVSDKQAFKSITEYIEIGKKEAKLVVGGDYSDKEGYFIPPTIFENVDPNSRIAQEEIFGPVLAAMKARDFDHALELANNTVYGLTGAVYSRNRYNLEKAREEFHVGNLYFNRKSTGALVGVHPFGGFNMSGTDSKAGGRDYLLLFTQAKAVSELL